ncbi:hypothetical protein [Pajaroellobacter abortibovis]|nr:hypothetical protein [Pajaroellobacter abortibovis]
MHPKLDVRRIVCWTAILLTSLFISSCRSSLLSPSSQIQEVKEPFHLTPLVDIAPAAQLKWIIELKPRRIQERKELARAVSYLFNQSYLQAFAEKYGGIELTKTEELVIASYPQTTLFLVRSPIVSFSIEEAFLNRVSLKGRSTESKAGVLGVAQRKIERMWGTMDKQEVQLTLFGQQACALAIGKGGPLHAAELFAQSKLKKASPSLQAPPLAQAAASLPNGLMRAFYAGPFEGEAARGFGGLLASSFSVSFSIESVQAPNSQTGWLRLTLLLMGAWNEKEHEFSVKERLNGWLQTFLNSEIGKWLQPNQLPALPLIYRDQDSIRLALTINADSLGRNFYLATKASMKEALGI